ncbi:MAG: InlB B-repeat-containing protein [Lachnospiraceae bacterium]|nr:InlB B-repeat-containing protein [Lachnospiraceae bacterium]
MKEKYMKLIVFFMVMVLCVSNISFTALAKEDNFPKGVTGYAVALEGSEKIIGRASSAVPTQEQAKDKMLALKSQYPEGTPYTNADYYEWKGGIYSAGYGCAAFAFMLSDAAFGDLPARMITNVEFKNVHVGDILRVNGDTHSVIVTEVKTSSVVLAEGNYNSSVHWGRTMSSTDVNKADYMLTRWPVGTFGEAYSLSFDANGGTGAPDQISVNSGETITIPSQIPMKTAYDFVGWAKSKSATSADYKVGDQIKITSNQILYAVWKAKEFTDISSKVGTRFNVTFTDSKMCKFVPDTTDDYTFESLTTDTSVDPVIYLYDDSFEMITTNDDGGEGFNFLLTYQMVEGHTYYVDFTSYSRSGASVSYDVSISKGSESVDPVDPVDPEEPEEPDEPEIITNPEEGTDLAQFVGQTIDVTLAKPNWSYMYTFTAPATKEYTFASFGESDPYIEIYDAQNNIIGANDDCNCDDFNFELSSIMEKGKIYAIYLVRFDDYNDVANFKLKITAKSHEHKFTNYEYNNDATYSKNGTKTAICDNGCGQSKTIEAAGTMKTLKKVTPVLSNAASGITIAWDKVTGASGYYVYRKDGSNYTKIATVNKDDTLSFTDTSVKTKNGSAYTYAVCAYCGDNKSQYVDKKTYRVTGVSISSLKNSSSKKMTVKWSKNSKATGYQIQYSKSSSFASGNKTVTVKGAGTVSKKISSLTKKKTYYVRVRAYKTVSSVKYYSAWSAKKSVKIKK